MKYSKPKVGEKIRKGDVLMTLENVYISGVEFSIAGVNMELRNIGGKIKIWEGDILFHENRPRSYNRWANIAFRKASK